MKATATIKSNESAFHRVGRVWCHAVSQERLAVHWLAGKRVPVWGGRLLFIIIKCVLFGVLLYAAFWATLLLVFVSAVVWLMLNSDLDNEKQPELRNGHSGIGWYNQDDLRIDMGDPDEPH